MTNPPKPESELTSAHYKGLRTPVAPWPFHIAAIMLLMVALAAVWRKVDASEVFFHLKAGQVILKNQQLPNRDIFSATSSVGMWVYFEWLWGLALATAMQLADSFLQRASEWIGVNFLCSIVATILVGLILIRSRRHEARWFESLIISILVMGGLLPVFQASPGIAALPVFLFSLLFTEATRKRWPLILYPAIAAIWANINIAAPLVLLIPLARAIFPDRPTITVREPITRKFFLMVAGAGAIGLLIVPHSYRIYSAWFHAGLISLESMEPNIVTALNDPSFWLRLVLALSFFGLSLWQRSISKWQVLSTAGLFPFAFAFSAEVINFLLVFLSGPAALALSKATQSTWNRRELLRNVAASGLLIGCVAWTAAVIAFGGITPNAWGSGVRPDKFPEMAAGRLSAIPIRATILNRRADAGYLLWRLWPGWKTAIDNRPGVYDEEFLEQYKSVWRGEAQWEAMLSLWRVQAVLGNREVFAESPGDNLYVRLADSDDWSAVYWDSDYILYVKSNIDLSSSNLSAFRQLKPGLTWSQQKSRIMTRLQWQELAADLRRAILDDPTNQEAHEFLRRAEVEIRS